MICPLPGSECAFHSLCMSTRYLGVANHKRPVASHAPICNYSRALATKILHHASALCPWRNGCIHAGHARYGGTVYVSCQVGDLLDDLVGGSWGFPLGLQQG